MTITILDCTGLLVRDNMYFYTTGSVPTSVKGFETRFFDKSEFIIPDLNIFSVEYSPNKQGEFYNIFNCIKPDVLIYSPIDFTYAMHRGDRCINVRRCNISNLLDAKLKMAVNMEYELRMVDTLVFSNNYLVINGSKIQLEVLQDGQIFYPVSASHQGEAYKGRPVKTQDGSLIAPIRKKLILEYIRDNPILLCGAFVDNCTETARTEDNSIKERLLAIRDELDRLIREM